MPETPSQAGSATLLSDLIGLPESFLQLCHQQAIVTVRQARDLCQHLYDNPEIRTAHAISKDDFDQAVALLPPHDNDEGARMSSYSDIPAGVLPLSLLPKDHPIHDESGEDPTVEPVEEKKGETE